jgi:hypothetical protein
MEIGEMFTETKNESVNLFRQQNDAAKIICKDTLVRLGYEVRPTTDQGVDFKIKKDNVEYSLCVTYADPESARYFRIPVGNKDIENNHIYNIKSDCIAFYQKDFEGGTIFQFKLQDLRNFITPIVKELKQKMHIRFYAENAINEKALHIDFFGKNGAIDIYIYIPIDFLTKQMKFSRQTINR